MIDLFFMISNQQAQQWKPGEKTLIADRMKHPLLISEAPWICAL